MQVLQPRGQRSACLDTISEHDHGHPLQVSGAPSSPWCSHIVFPPGDPTLVPHELPRAVPKVLAPRVGLVTQGRAAVAEDGNTRSARMSCMTYVAAEDRYESMTYRRVGRSGVKLPLISLGLWHNFGDDRSLDTQRAILRLSLIH